MIIRKEILGFNSIFPNEDYNKYLEDIKDIPKYFLLKVSVLFLNFTNKHDFVNNHYEFLSNYFSSSNFIIANEIYKKINEYVNTHNNEIVIINSMSSLKLFEKILSFKEPQKTISETECEVLFLKAYLAFNQKQLENDKRIMSSINKNQKYNDLIKLAISNSLATFDLFNFNLKSVFYTQIFKTVCFLKFLKSRNEFEMLLNVFCKNFRINNEADYINIMLRLSLAVIDNREKGNYYITINDTEVQDIYSHFLNQVSVSHLDSENHQQYDFIYLRTYPLIQVNNNSYQVFFPLFLLEKTFNGLYFHLKNINDNLPINERIDLKRIVSHNFSEKYLLYSLIENIYAKKYIKIRGNDIKSSVTTDYYMRNGNKVFVFESKDIFINAKVKTTYDFNEYENSLKKKLYFDITKKNKMELKAVKQLAIFIESLLSSCFKDDKGLNPKKIQIYPIIILHNRQLDILGLNCMINTWFMDELELLKAKKIKTTNVHNITIINIDTLIIFQEQLKNGAIQLEKVISEYHRKINYWSKCNTNLKNKDDLLLESLLSFNMFVEKYYKWSIPKGFKHILHQILNN